MARKQTELFFLPLILVLALILVNNISKAQESAHQPSLLEVNPPNSPNNYIPKAIVGIKLIDGLGNEPLENATVIISGNRIMEVGPQDQVRVPANAEVIQGKGMSLLPGLVDAHLHSVNNNNMTNAFLKNGVTTMRDPGHPFRFYQSTEFAETPLPRIFLTGAHLDAYPGVYTQQAIFIRDAKHARETVASHVKNGGTGIKIYFRLPLELFETVIHTADFYHIPVVAHLEMVKAEDAIRAGLKGIEHVTSFGSSLIEAEAAQAYQEEVKKDNNFRREGRYMIWSNIDLNTQKVKEVLDLAVREKVTLIPTLVAYEQQEGDESAKDYQLAGYKKMVEFVRMAHHAGVKIGVGSHTAGKYTQRGLAFQKEMELLVDAGLTPLEAISSGTFHNAQYLRTDRRIGSIEPGKLADLILVEGDPTMDIKDMYKVQKVMLNGKWVDRN